MAENETAEDIQRLACWCWRCHEERGDEIWFMIVCPDCGNKRCPHANDHRNECTKSNDAGQDGSAYQHGSGAATARRFATTEGDA